VTGYWDRPPGFRITKTSEEVWMQNAVGEWPRPTVIGSLAAITERD
jgi:hypothetical protein